MSMTAAGFVLRSRSAVMVSGLSPVRQLSRERVVLVAGLLYARERERILLAQAWH